MVWTRIESIIWSIFTVKVIDYRFRFLLIVLLQYTIDNFHAVSKLKEVIFLLLNEEILALNQNLEIQIQKNNNAQNRSRLSLLRA